jgi:molybdate transport system substrate-binding protein
MNRRLGRSALALAALALETTASAEEVHLYAAASLTDAVTELARTFETETGHKVVFNFGGSNDLARQIKAGAPADVFFSADAAQMDGLQAAGLVRAEDRIDVLSNVLAVVTPAASPVRIGAPSDLLALRRIAMGDPEAVPAGVYARAWLRSLGLWERLKDNVVPSLNVRAALAAVEAEDADAGIVYRTDAAISRRIKVAFEVLREQGPSIVYPLARIAASKKSATAALVRHLTSERARAVYGRLGFVVLPER